MIVTLNRPDKYPDEILTTVYDHGNLETYCLVLAVEETEKKLAMFLALAQALEIKDEPWAKDIYERLKENYRIVNERAEEAWNDLTCALTDSEVETTEVESE